MAKRKNYPGNLEKRGNAYRWRVCVGGQRYRETLHTTTRKEAEKRARERYREIEKRAERYRDGGTGFPAPSLLGFFDQFEAEVDRPTPSSGAQGGNKSEPLAYYHLTNYSSANDN